MDTSTKLLYYRHSTDGPGHIAVELGNRIANIPRQYVPERDTEAQMIASGMVDRWNAYPDLLAQRDELLAALESLLKMDETSTGEGLWIHGGSNEDQNELEVLIEAARQAIANATK